MTTISGNLRCSYCGFWVSDTGDWFCEECHEPTCERCGKYEDEEEVYLCLDCFLKDGKDA